MTDKRKPCGGVNANVCVAEGCYGEACLASFSPAIPLPWSEPPLTGNRTRGNPFARAAEVAAAKSQAAWAIRASKVKPVAAAEIVLHFRPDTKRRRDADGMFPTLKVCQDALVACGVLIEDSWVTVPAATCRIHHPTSEPAAMWLELTNVTNYQESHR